MLFALEHYNEVLASSASQSEYNKLMARMVPYLKTSLVEDCGKASGAAKAAANQDA